METSIKKSRVMKRTIQMTAIAILLIIFTSSIFLLGSKAYFPEPPKHNPPAAITSVGPDVHYAIGSHRIVCMGCTGPQSVANLQHGSK